MLLSFLSVVEGCNFLCAWKLYLKFPLDQVCWQSILSVFLNQEASLFFLFWWIFALHIGIFLTLFPLSNLRMSFQCFSKLYCFWWLVRCHCTVDHLHIMCPFSLASFNTSFYQWFFVISLWWAHISFFFPFYAMIPLVSWL